MKKNKNLSRNDCKKTHNNATRTQSHAFKPLSFANPRFSFKDIAQFAYSEIDAIADQCGLSTTLLYKIIQAHALPVILCAGIVDNFQILDYGVSIRIDVMIIADQNGETFPIIGFSMDGKSSVFNGHKWFLKNEQNFLELLNDQRKINAMTESLGMNPIVLIPVGGV